MSATLAVVIAVIALAGFGVWYVALWRGWRDASRDQTSTERRVVVSGITLLMLLPIALAVAGVSDGEALIAIVVAMAVVIPLLVIVGARDHRRRQDRIKSAPPTTLERRSLRCLPRPRDERASCDSRATVGVPTGVVTDAAPKRRTPDIARSSKLPKARLSLAHARGYKAAMRVIVGSALICLPGILIGAGLFFAFGSHEIWLLTASALSWLAGGVLVADWKAVLLVGFVSTATAIFVSVADPWSPGDSGLLVFYLFVAIPYTAISAVIVSAGVLINRVSA